MEQTTSFNTGLIQTIERNALPLIYDLIICMLWSKYFSNLVLVNRAWLSIDATFASQTQCITFLQACWNLILWHNLHGMRFIEFATFSALYEFNFHRFSFSISFLWNIVEPSIYEMKIIFDNFLILRNIII